MRPSIAEVSAIYDAEQAAGKKARTLADVPGTYEAITDEWLTAVVCRNAPGAAVTAHQVVDRSDGSSNRARIRLTYNDAGHKAGLPPTVFCKGVVTKKNRVLQAVCGGAKGEPDIFNLVRNVVNIETPVHLHAAYDPRSYAYIIVMQDMGGISDFCNEKSVISRAQAEKICNTLAKLHARYYESPDLGTLRLPFKTWPEFWADAVDGNPGWEEACDSAVDAAVDVIPPGVYKRRSEIWAKTQLSVARHNVLPKTLVHCDVHLGNWYKAGNGDMGVTDWQAASIGHWSRDFIYAISTTLAIEDRRAWFDDLLNLYLAKMVEYGAPKINRDDALLNIRQQLMTTLAFWTITLRPAPNMPPMQPESISYALIKRITAAMDDMDALDAF